jgi:sporulation protein YlmC with PRC-barrel domain
MKNKRPKKFRTVTTERIIFLILIDFNGDVLVNYDKLSGKYVICAGGFDLGEVNGLEMDTNAWKVTHLHIKLSKPASQDLGFKKRFRTSTVCLPISLVASVGDNILLNKSLDELSRHPEISECVE